MTAPRLHATAGLRPLLQRARQRWRLRHLAVGVAITTCVVVLAIGAGSIVLEAARFSAGAISAARAIIGVVTAVVAARWIAWPLVRRLSDERLALYLEERVPQLGGAVLTAVTLRPQADAGHSALLERGLLADATRRLGDTSAVPLLERPATIRALTVAFAAVLFAALALQFGPSFLRVGARRLLSPWQDAVAAPVYAIALEPQRLAVPRGSDVQLAASLSGFVSEAVDLVVRRGTSAEVERIPMASGGTPGSFSVRLLDVAEDTEYYAEANGVRSGIGLLTVKDLPGVQRIGVELRFPAYMNLPAEITEDGGDIAAPGGATAVLRVRTTRPVSRGSLVFDGGRTIPLVRVDDSTVTARVPVQRDGFYRVELVSADGTVVRGTVEYVVDMLEDAAPSVRIRQPGRDLRPTSVDEVLIEAEATDDFGISSLEIVYRVNGGDEKVVSLAQGSGVRPREVVATHTLFLEEMSLAAGDVVSYYARALDNDQRPRPKPAASDIQFLTIRPFSREYRQNQQSRGGQGGGEQETNPGSLVERQREIVAGTFKTERDRGKMPAAALRADVSTLHLSQGRLREELVALVRRVSRPGAQAADSSFRILAEVLPKAGTEMKAAEELLVQGKTADALAPEQRALQWLEKAEAAFREVQVSMQQQGGGGGGGGGGANASDLADLLELETDKMRNQYDQVQRSRQETGAKRTDETLERLKQLAARQQQELARQRADARGSGTGGVSQRQLAEETEAAARQLERLAREQQSPEMQQTADEMRRAAESMRRSAASGGAGAAQAAADRLERARQALENAKQQGTGEGLGDATVRARSLAEEQRGVQRDVEQLGNASADRSERQQRIDERKAGMEERVKALAADLERFARETRATNPRATRAAQEASATIRESRLSDKIRYSRDVIRTNGSREYARRFEGAIQQDLDSLAQKVAAAAGAAVAGRDSSQRSSRTLAQARDLVRGLGSLEQRVGERGRSAATQQGQGRQQGQGQQQGAGSGQGQGQGQSQGQAQGQASGSEGGQGQGEGQGEGRGQGQRAEGQQGGAGQGRPSGAGSPGSFSAEEARQLSRELRTRREAAQQLRRAVAGSGVDTRDLDRAITRLSALDGAKLLGDPVAMQQLRDGVMENLKSFEFTLRRALGDGAAGGPVLGGSERVPAKYREMVDEYFKSLSRAP